MPIALYSGIRLSQYVLAATQKPQGTPTLPRDKYSVLTGDQGSLGDHAGNSSDAGLVVSRMGAAVEPICLM